MDGEVSHQQWEGWGKEKPVKANRDGKLELGGIAIIQGLYIKIVN